MITQIHMIWVNNDLPTESAQGAADSWRATGLPLRMWTRGELIACFGSCYGPPNVQANYYRVKILGTIGGFYVDADSFAQPGSGDALRRILPTADIVACGMPNSHEFNNAPMGATANVPGWDWLFEQPDRLYQRWNEWLRTRESFTALPGATWNAPKPGPGVLCVHKFGSLGRGKQLPSIRTFPLADGSLAQLAEDWQFAALRKSGHHAILRWAGNLTGQTLWHFNDCVVSSKPGTFRADTKAVLQEGDVPPLRLCNFEDSDLQGLVADRQLLIVRHPWNCFASRIKGSHRFAANWLNTDLWKLHAREFLNPDSPFVKINYDRWHVSREYRDNIARERLGYFPIDDRSGVPEIGQSMFDGRKFDGRAEEMDVLDRWQTMREHPDMQPILADKELRELWQRIEAMP